MGDMIAVMLVLALWCYALYLAWHTAAPPSAGDRQAPPPAVGDIRLDGLVQHYLSAGVVRHRHEDDLPFDQPLAPNAPRPSRISLREIVPDVLDAG